MTLPAAVLFDMDGTLIDSEPAWMAAEARLAAEFGIDWTAADAAALVGIDSLNIDDVESGGERPAHSLLLGAGVPVVEHLTGLEQLPATGARFTAVPPKVSGFGTFPVRAFAVLPGGTG